MNEIQYNKVMYKESQSIAIDTSNGIMHHDAFVNLKNTVKKKFIAYMTL